MMYTNESKSFLSYEIIGEITMNILEFKEDSGSLTIKGDIADIFYREFLEKATNGIPLLEVGKHAFNLRLVSVQANRVVRNLTVLIVEINSYRISDDHKTCHICVRYNKIPTINTDPRTLTVIKPCISHIFADGDFLGMLIEGSSEAILDMVNTELRGFIHGNKIYYTNGMSISTVTMEDNPTITSKRYSTIGVLVASTVKVPSKEDMNAFKHAFEYFIKSIYSFNNVSLP